MFWWSARSSPDAATARAADTGARSGGARARNVPRRLRGHQPRQARFTGGSCRAADLFAFSDTMEERWGRRDREAERMPSS